jgi:predicted nucleic acid-binding protein
LPVLDTVVLFGAADPKDPHHRESNEYLGRLTESSYYIAGFALFEFDIVMKSRGFTFKERMLRHALLARDYPASTSKTRALSPTTLYLAADIEGTQRIDYFDAGVAAEAKALDGAVVSPDRVFDSLHGVKRIW